MSTTLYQGWDHRWLGTATLGWTDSSGTFSISTASTDKLSHLAMSAVDPKDRGSTTIDTGFSDFATWLQTAMDASASARTFTVTWTAATLAYDITPDSGTIALTFTGSAGATMRRILGFTANKSADTTQKSDMRPWYVMRTQVDGRTNYNFPTVKEGQVRSSMADDGTLYTIAPTRLVKEASWEHHFEPPEAMHIRFAVADTLAAGASWTWEDFLNHSARYAVPNVIVDSTESMVYRSGVAFDRNSARRRQKDTDPQQTVAIRAESIVGWL